MISVCYRFCCSSAKQAGRCRAACKQYLHFAEGPSALLDSRSRDQLHGCISRHLCAGPEDEDMEAAELPADNTCRLKEAPSTDLCALLPRMLQAECGSSCLCEWLPRKPGASHCPTGLSCHGSMRLTGHTAVAEHSRADACTCLQPTASCHAASKILLAYWAHGAQSRR